MSRSCRMTAIWSISLRCTHPSPRSSVSSWSTIPYVCSNSRLGREEQSVGMSVGSEASSGCGNSRMLIEPGPMRRMMVKLVAALAIAGSLVVAGGGAAGAADPDMQQVLAPTGKLRVGLYPGTPTSILPDAQSGGPRGVGYDLGQ